MTDFIIIGNMNAITYKEIFPYLKDNKMWLGYNHPHYFEVPLEKVEDEKKQYEEGGKIYQAFGNICWFTNLEHNKRKEFIGLTKRYNSDDYPKYENYDAIEVSKVNNIPKDYDGVMGVPISYLEKHSPKQFEILGMCDNEDTWNLKTRKYTTEECKKAYIDKFGKNGVYDLNASSVIVKDGKRHKTYARILIRKVKELPTEEEVKNIAE